MYVRFPLSLRNLEDLLFARGVEVCHKTVRLWWHRIGEMFAGEIRRQPVSGMLGFRQWRWYLDQMYVKSRGEIVWLRRAVDHEGEVLESYVTESSRQARCSNLHENGVHAPRLTRVDHKDGLRATALQWMSSAIVGSSRSTVR